MIQDTTPPMPASAPFTDRQFADSLNVSTETVRDYVTRYDLKGVKRLGNKVIIVDAAAFYGSMPDFTTVAPDVIQKRPAKPKSR